MKRFKELTEELFTEGDDRYPADDMTMSELKIAINAAQNILDMLEDGAMIQRWQISAIVKASDELASVCTNMRADVDEERQDEEEWLNGYEEDEEPMYVGFEYPSMYGEETKLDEGFKEKIKGAIRREKQKEYPLIQNRRDVAATKAGAAYATGDQKKGDRYMKWRSDNMNKEEVELDETSAFFHSEMDKLSKKAHANAAEKSKKSGPVTSKTLADINAKLGNTKKTNEETDYEVDVEGLPKMFVKANSPAEVKNNLRKVVKNPEMIRGVERVAKATLQKIFRDKASGKEVAEEVELDEISDEMKKKYIRAVADKGGIFRKPRPASLAGIDKKKEDALVKAFKGGSMQQYVNLHKKSEKRAEIGTKAIHSLKKEEVELGEASDLRITKVYNKKKATYAVHSPDRKYYKEFDTMDAAKAHHAEKTGK
jgi:hypothetical protein